MAEAGNTVDEKKEYFSRVNLALTDCGRRVLLNLLLKRVRELTPIDHQNQPWSLDEFLNHNMQNILIGIGSDINKKKILYPFKQDTDLTKWDIPLFVCVLLNACELNHHPLYCQLKHDICNLIRLRNKLFHMGTPTFDEQIYLKLFGRIVGAVQRICDYMQELDLKESLSKELDKYESLKHVYPNGLISELGCKSVDMMNEADAAVENGLQQIQMIIQKKRLSVNIPILEVMIMFRNYNKEDERAITEQLHGLFSQALEHGEGMSADRSSSELDVEVKSLVRKLFEEKRKITKVSTGCLVLSIQCHDIDAVISLVQDNLSGKLGSLFEPFEEAMRTYEDHALFEIYVGITRQSCWALLNEMFCQVSDQCGQRSCTVESTVQDDGIVVKIQRFLQSFTDKEKLEESFSSKEKQEIYQTIAEKMALNLEQPGMAMVVLSPKHSQDIRSNAVLDESGIVDLLHSMNVDADYHRAGRLEIGVEPVKEQKEKTHHRSHLELNDDENLATILREETSGTAAEFVPVSGLYTSVKNGVLQNENVSYQCITMMENYTEFSLEELRFEDYLFSRGKPSPQKGSEASLIRRLQDGRITLRKSSEVKFKPRFRLETIVKDGQTQAVNTLHYCIAAMTEYTDTSLEELRVKDYERWLGKPFNAFNACLQQEEEIRPRTETEMASDTDFLPETSTSVAASMIHYGKSGQRDGTETICTKYLEDRCKDPTCQFLHLDQKLPYMWQINLADKTWASLPMNVEIEDKFCASADRAEIYNIIKCMIEKFKKQKSKHKTLNVLNKEVVFQIQFKANLFAVQAGSSQPVAVRRLSTPAYTFKKDVCEAPNKFVTQWRWFWQDDEGGWNKFTPDSLQQTLEMRYRTQQTQQTEQRYYSFFLEDGTYLYDVDLQQMTQTNIVTSKTREVRRRPLLVMPNDIIYQTGPESFSLVEPMQADIETPQHWSPQDSIHSFELVRVSLGQEYTTVATKFFETMPRKDIQKPAIYRVQNIDLWSQYISKRKRMQIEAIRLGRYKDLEIRELFYGTDTLEAAREICIHNIDPRVSGKHGTAFGHGAYFARDAGYSDRYTTGGSGFVFLTSVLVGENTRGNEDYRRPSSKPGTMHEYLFDTCGDSMTDPAVFVAFDRAQYYPGYLIVYKNRR